MTYELTFKKSALKEWKKLGPAVRELFARKLKERLSHPHVPSAAVKGGSNCSGQLIPDSKLDRFSALA
ncbi:MAG: hypothetical protein WEB57_10660, partial [Pseudohongiellaceae bacterium]